MIRITICEDHELVRTGLIKLVQGFGCEVQDALGTGEALISSVRAKTPDLVLLDISLPGRSGLETLKNLLAFFPNMNVIILSMHSEAEYALRMLKSGAKSYLNKNCTSEVLNEAILTVARGEEYISPDLAKVLFSNIHNENNVSPHKKLSDREFEVFLALGEGISLSELGLKLNLSVKTVSTYKSRIFEKMNITSSSEIVKYLINNKLNSEIELLENV